MIVNKFSIKIVVVGSRSLFELFRNENRDEEVLKTHSTFLSYFVNTVAP
jgi:hypothetical protein